MQRFTTRVQLYGDPHWGDYQRLHASMKRKGFTQGMEDSNGIDYELARAEYNREGNVTPDQVLKDAKEATAPVWDHFSISVRDSAGRTWDKIVK